MLVLKILKEYIRRIGRNYKIYTVSILGMGIAIIASFHIYHFVYKELSVDSFHTKKKEVYRLAQKYNGSDFPNTETPLPLGSVLKENFPEVKNFTRISSRDGMIMQVGDNNHKTDIAYIDASFFELFNFSLKKGSVNQFNDTPNGIIISEKAAKTLFGEEKPLGKIITVSKEYDPKKLEYVVTGILNNIPQNSTIQGDYFINIESLQKNVSLTSQWVTTSGMTNLFIHAPALKNSKEFSEKAANLLFSKTKTAAKEMFGMDEGAINFKLYLQRLDNIYFNSVDIVRQKKKGDSQFLKIIILVGLLALFLATSNYIIMNLGLNLNRVKEFKTKRYLGVTKGGVFMQLVLESLLNTIICFALTMLTYPFIGEFVSNIIGFNYNLSIAYDGMLLFTYFVIILFLGLLVGSLEYALSYKSIFVKGTSNKSSWGSKKMMIGFQLFLFMALAICILFVGKQVSFIQSKDLGFDIQNVAQISTRNDKELKGFLDTKSYIKNTSYSQGIFSSTFNLTPFKGENTKVDAIIKNGDYNFLNVNSMELLYGENFPEKDISTDLKEDSKKGNGLTLALVNEEFVRKANLKDPIGKTFKVENYKEFVISGVVKNVYSTPLYYPVQPLVISDRDYSGWYYGLLSVSYEEGARKQLYEDVQGFFTKRGVNPMFLQEIIFEYDYGDIYKKEIQLKSLLEAFTVIVLIISLLGMIAISLFITESKTKEIGIRKVNGASINQVMLLLNKNFVKWVAVAFVVACPIAYYTMNKWLESFAYKTSLSWWVFALAGLFTLIIALLTVSWQTYRAARANPVKSLRAE